MNCGAKIDSRNGIYGGELHENIELGFIRIDWITIINYKAYRHTICHS